MKFLSSTAFGVHFPLSKAPTFLFFFLTKLERRMESSSISSELFFNETEFRVLIPNVSSETEPSPQEILSSPSRRFTFYGKNTSYHTTS